MEQHNTSWDQLMRAAEQAAESTLNRGELAEQAVESHVAALVSHCPGFQEHEYRQAYWQGLQNLRQRYAEGEASLPA
jgi:hypothetical protein